ncbi:hypothetical protein Droror1_Dr00004008 [Drosera rotundifolia]
MDLKGISWVGNMYQKFEAMCVEVEETLYEDTVQYVENQAKTVGTCLKKFYADVMQDLLLESCVDPTKADNPVQGIVQHADLESYDGRKTSVKKEPINVKRAVRKNPRSSLAGKQTDNSSVAVNLCKPLPRDAAEDKWADWNWEQNESDPGFIIHSRRKFPSSEISRRARAGIKEIGVASRDADLDGVEEATHTEVVGSDSASLFEGKGAVCQDNANTKESIASIPFDSPSLKVNLDEIGNEGTVMVDFRHEHVPSESDVAKSPDTKRSSDDHMQSVEEPCLPDTGRPSHLDENARDDPGDVETEVARMLDSPNLEESCILVDKYETSISNTTGKRRSYKKKLRDALSPRKWSKSKDHEHSYEDRRASLLATCSTNLGERNLEALDPCESDWELL